MPLARVLLCSRLSNIFSGLNVCPLDFSLVIKNFRTKVEVYNKHFCSFSFTFFNLRYFSLFSLVRLTLLYLVVQAEDHAKINNKHV